MKYEILVPFITYLERLGCSRDLASISPFYDLLFAYGHAWLEIGDYLNLGARPNGKCKYETGWTEYERHKIASLVG